MVSYIGVERTIISYNFTLNIWTMRDVTNPSVTAVSEASFRSLAIGNIKWTISNDTKCSKGLWKLKHDKTISVLLKQEATVRCSL